MLRGGRAGSTRLSACGGLAGIGAGEGVGRQPSAKQPWQSMNLRNGILLMDGNRGNANSREWLARELGTVGQERREIP